MSILKDLVSITERIDGLNGLAEAFKKFDQAETKLGKLCTTPAAA
jgi:hypothetical protein